MQQEEKDIIKNYIKKIASNGGKKTAQLYSYEVRKKWGLKGGRPKKKSTSKGAR